MDNLLQLAMQIVFCLLIAAVLGAIIGYLLGKMSKCGKDDYDYDEFSEKRVLNDYTDENIQYNENLAQGISKNKTAQAVIGTTAIDTKNSAPAINKKVIEAVKEDSTFTTGPGQEIGIRPEAIDAPMNGEFEDLKEISGIGIKIEEVLHSLGIYHFEQIANWTPENIEWIENYLTLKGRIKKEDWISQAKLLAAGGQTEFSKKVRRGENRNYK
jgi:predicted flap endonuclease-1-like 5' DNA nuclease